MTEAPDDHVLGADIAPITMIMYASVTCGHCGRWFQDEWDAIKNVIDWNSSAALDYQLYLFNITLLENSTNDVGFAVYNFNVGWDEEHGLCIAMKRDKVASVSGLGDYRI